MRKNDVDRSKLRNRFSWPMQIQFRSKSMSHKQHKQTVVRLNITLTKEWTKQQIDTHTASIISYLAMFFFRCKHFITINFHFFRVLLLLLKFKQNSLHSQNTHF